MPVILQKWITRADLQANPAITYVFGDNEERWGLGGQAKEMRGEPNANGVATLVSPDVFWREDDAERQCAVIDSDMAQLFEIAGTRALIVWPLDGIGTGLADLQRRSPTTFNHIQTRLAALKGIS